MICKGIGECRAIKLTSAANTFVGAAGDDVFDGGTSNTLSAFDNLDGGAGAGDSLTALISTTTLPGALTIKNIETATVNTTGGGLTGDFTSWTGLANLTVQSSAAGAISVTGASTTALSVAGTGGSSIDVIGTGGALSVTTGADAVKIGQTAVVNALTSVSVDGGTTVQISDNKTTTKADGTTLKTVSLKGNTGAVTLDTDGLTSLTLTNIVKDAADVTINANAGTRALTVNVSGIDDDAAGSILVTDGTATSLAINATGTSKDMKFTAGAAKSVTIDAAAALTIDDLVAGVATAVSISGAAKTTITADTLAAAAVVTSTSTGGVTITQALTANQQFVGTSSSGKDSISIAASSTKAHSTGAGDDTVIIAGAFASGGSVDAGEGTDILSLDTALAADTLDANTTFEGLISGFEKLALTTAGVTKDVNLENLDDINFVTLSGATAVTLTNLASAGTVELTAASTKVIATVKDAVLNTSDVLNIIATNAAGVDVGEVDAANVETIAINSNDTATTSTGIEHTLKVTDAAAKTITVTGDAGLILTFNGTALTNFDASGVTDGDVTWTTGALAAAATIKGGATADTNTIDFSLATGGVVTYTGGSQADTITGSNGKNNVVDLGNGTNSYTQTGAGNATVTGGTGADTISVGTGANTVNSGDGNDIITVAAAAAGTTTINVGAGTDKVVIAGAPSAAGYYTSITGMAAGDQIDLSGATTVASTVTPLGAKITLGGASSFANYLDAAAATQIADGAASLIKWFQYNGNTYIVVDDTKAADTPDDNVTFQDGIDTVVELVGLIDLSKSTVAADVITIV